MDLGFYGGLMYLAPASRLEPEAVTSLPADGEETARTHLANFFAERCPEEQVAVGEAVPQYVYPDEMRVLDFIGAPDDVVPPAMMDAPAPTGGGTVGRTMILGFGLVQTGNQFVDIAVLVGEKGSTSSPPPTVFGVYSKAPYGLSFFTAGFWVRGGAPGWDRLSSDSPGSGVKGV